MGAWGTGISSNDTTAEVYDQFIDLYNEGHTPTEISARLIRDNQETIGIEEDSANFWFALAKAQWECKALDPEIRTRVEKIIESGEDLAAWKELGATASNLRARQKALDKFLVRIRTERSNPRKRRKKRYYDSIFRKGDCLVYKMKNGNYGGAFVLTDETGTEAGQNYIAVTTIDKADKPTMRDFEQGEVYVIWADQISFIGTKLHRDWVDEPQIGSISALAIKQKTFEIEVIGTLPMYKEYSVERYVGYGWVALQIMVPARKEYEAVHGKPKSKLMLSTWTKKPWWNSFASRKN